MITGFNTDVEHGGIIYHVQTEDKGLDTPIILSLVYSGGAILASKRSPYTDLIAEGFTDEALAERLKRQHRLICAAIHSGRINDLRRMAAREPEVVYAAPVEPPVEPPVVEPPAVETEAPVEPPPVVEVPVEPPLAPPAAVEIPAITLASLDVVEATSGEEFELSSVEMSEPMRTETIEQPHYGGEIPTIDIIELEEVPADSIQSVSVEPSAPEAEREPSSEFTFEFDYQPRYEPPSEPVYTPVERDDEETIVTQAPSSQYDFEEPYRQGEFQRPVGAEDGLALTLLDEDEFFSGDARMLRVLVSYRSGDYDKPLANVPLSIKILGTTFRPLLYSLKTERDGVATVSTQIPHFTSGRAAVLIKAAVKGEAAELRRVIHPAR